MKEPAVSVVIPAFNSALYIKDALDSVLRQSAVDFEIIVIDDGSKDDIEQVIQEYHSCRFYKKKNGGPASARNFGVQMAKGKYIAFLDADDVWLPGKLYSQLKKIEAVPAIGLVYSFSGNFHESVLEIKENTDLPCNVTYEGDLFNKIYWHNFIRTSTVLVKKECFDTCGMFNEEEDFFAVEDYDMWLRVAKEYKVACVPEVLVGYRCHGEGISKYIDRSYKNEKNVLLAASARWPGLKRDTGVSFKKRLSKLYLDWGADYLEIGDLSKARQLLKRSVLNDFTSFKGVVFLLKSFLPVELLKKMRRIKRGK